MIFLYLKVENGVCSLVNQWHVSRMFFEVHMNFEMGIFLSVCLVDDVWKTLRHNQPLCQHLLVFRLNYIMHCNRWNVVRNVCYTFVLDNNTHLPILLSSTRFLERYFYNYFISFKYNDDWWSVMITENCTPVLFAKPFSWS